MRGVSSLQKQWLAKQDSADIVVFVVWSDQLGATVEDVPEAAALMPDPRVRHYWDGDNVLGRAYQSSLEHAGRATTLEWPAWDVWLLFGRDARWGDGGPPAPAWWEHQLRGRMPDELRLDAVRFAARAGELLAKE